ncbi:MAG TPA: rod shape-determining protein MreC [Candidatus Binatia bacterium]
MPRNRTVRLAVLGSSVQRTAASGYQSNRSSAVKRRIIVGSLVVLSLVLITISFRSTALDGVESEAATVLRPFEVAADRVSAPFRDSVNWFHGLVDARSENSQLKAENAQLRHQLVLDQTALYQNVQLQNQLHYLGPPSVAAFRRVNTEVLTNPQTPIDQSVTIAAGAKSGLKTGDVVIAANAGGIGGLVGTVTRVWSGVARVTLLTDSSSHVSATDVTSPSAIGIVSSGDSGDVLIFDRVSKTKRVDRGDTIVTSGSIGKGALPSLYPKGIVIGTVSYQSESDANAFQTIQVQPLVDFSSVRSVIVLVPR